MTKLILWKILLNLTHIGWRKFTQNEITLIEYSIKVVYFDSNYFENHILGTFEEIVRILIWKFNSNEIPWQLPGKMKGLTIINWVLGEKPCRGTLLPNEIGAIGGSTHFGLCGILRDHGIHCTEWAIKTIPCRKALNLLSLVHYLRWRPKRVTIVLLWWLWNSVPSFFLHWLPSKLLQRLRIIGRNHLGQHGLHFRTCGGSIILLLLLMMIIMFTSESFTIDTSNVVVDVDAVIHKACEQWAWCRTVPH